MKYSHGYTTEELKKLKENKDKGALSVDKVRSVSHSNSLKFPVANFSRLKFQVGKPGIES